MILAIDPGNVQSAFVVLDENLKPVEIGKIENTELLERLVDIICKNKVKHVAIEMIASYGMAVGETVFETCVWIGRFWEKADKMIYVKNITKVYRKDVKMNLCNSTRAKDGNIRQALIDRFGVVGVKKNPGWFYGFKADIWAAYAVGVTYADKREGIK